MPKDTDMECGAVCRVSVNAQTGIFTSTKILQNVQNCRAGRE